MEVYWLLITQNKYSFGIEKYFRCPFIGCFMCFFITSIILQKDINYHFLG